MRWVVLVLAMSLPAEAAAQYVDLTRPDPIANELTEVRLSQQMERREAGIVLGVEGLASLVAGALTAGIVYQDPFVLSFGLGTAAWGAVNAGLSIWLLDVGDQGFARIRADRSLRGEELARARESALRAQLDTAAVYALNLGLDVFYIATGVLLFFLADLIDDPADGELLRGYSAAMAGQGVFLFGFDLVEWLASIARADRIGRIEIPR